MFWPGLKRGSLNKTRNSKRADLQRTTVRNNIYMNCPMRYPDLEL